MAFELPETKTIVEVPRRIGLIDADCVAYWAAAGCDDMTRDAAFRRLEGRMEVIMDQIETTNVRSFLTGKDNFRNDIATYQQYKGNRYDKNGNRIRPQPKWLPEVRDRILETPEYKPTLCDGQEADDALAIAQMKCRATKTWHSIISSIDKDLRICPGLHHDMTSGIIEDITDLGYLALDKKGKVRGGGLKFFYAQLLMGDTADWIKGLPKVTPWMKNTFEDIKRLGGCGAKAAYHVIKDAESEEECLNRVLDCYESYWDGDHFYVNWLTGETIYPTPEEMVLENGRLLWMRRKENQMWDIPVDVLAYRKEANAKSQNTEDQTR